MVAEHGWTPSIRLLGATAADVRDVMVKGPAGILATADPHFRPRYQPSNRLLEWPNGVKAHTFSADEPDRLRGWEGGWEWWDEFCAFKYPQEVMDFALPGLRMKTPGWEPRFMVTTTPKPLATLKAMLADPSTVTTTGTTYENIPHLAATFVERIIRRFEGSNIGRQELLAEILGEVEGALWTLRMIDMNRCRPTFEPARARLHRLAVGVDPPTSVNGTCGIVVVGAGPAPESFHPTGPGSEFFKPAKGTHGYVLDDRSLEGGKPAEWAAAAVKAYRDYNADQIVAEVNQGGDMVETIIHAQDPNVPVKQVHASRGKFARAEPISQLYQQWRMHHVGAHGKLEDEMTTWTRDVKEWSPDRMDALVWAATEVMDVGETWADAAAPGTLEKLSAWIRDDAAGG
jgi:phage terminase large subunit-like protein